MKKKKKRLKKSVLCFGFVKDGDGKIIVRMDGQTEVAPPHCYVGAN